MESKPCISMIRQNGNKNTSAIGDLLFLKFEIILILCILCTFRYEMHWAFKAPLIINLPTVSNGEVLVQIHVQDQVWKEGDFKSLPSSGGIIHGPFGFEYLGPYKQLEQLGPQQCRFRTEVRRGKLTLPLRFICYGEIYEAINNALR